MIWIHPQQVGLLYYAQWLVLVLDRQFQLIFKNCFYLMCLCGQKCTGDLKSISEIWILVEILSNRSKIFLKIAKYWAKNKFSKKFFFGLILYISKPMIWGKKVPCYYTSSGLIFYHLANFRHRFLIY